MFEAVTGSPPHPPVRWRLPDRRETRRIFVICHKGRFRVLAPDENPAAFPGIPYTVDISYVGGVPAECFCDGPRVGSEMEALIDDACISISRELQYGQSPEFLRDRYSRQSDGNAASIQGAIVDAIIADMPLYAREYRASRPLLEAVQRIVWRAKGAGA